MSFNSATDAAAVAAKDNFIHNIRDQLALNFTAESNKSFEGMKQRLKTANTIAKLINKQMPAVFDTLLAKNSFGGI